MIDVLRDNIQIGYIATILYFVLLGCYMLARRGDSACSQGEVLAKRRMTRSVGLFMFFWAFSYFAYLVPILYGLYSTHPSYDVCFIVSLMIEIPALYHIMHAVVQKNVNTLRWTCGLMAPFLVVLIWYIISLGGHHTLIPVYATSVLDVVFIVYLFFRHFKGYKSYIRRIRSEYSDITDREIVWSWSCFSGFALQSLIFLLYDLFSLQELSLYYWAFSLINGAYLCYCTCRQKPLDIEIEDDDEEDFAATAEEKREEKAFYAIIEDKLQTMCEEKLLFLDPDLTRDTLCSHLSISGTYLKLYFRSRDLSFYQYINTLRVRYAYKLMQDNPSMPIRDVCVQSGFRSQTTFRKMFKEVMDCLPSEVKTTNE